MIKRRDVDFGAACKAWGSKTNTSALYKRETSFAYTFRWKTCTLEFLFGACFVRAFLELELIVVVFTFKICCLFVHSPHPIPPHIYRLYPSIEVHKLPWPRGLPLSGISLIALISQPDTKPDHKQWLLRAQIMAVSLQPESSLRGDKWGSRSCSWRVVLSGRELENDREKKRSWRCGAPSLTTKVDGDGCFSFKYSFSVAGFFCVCLQHLVSLGLEKILLFRFTNNSYSCDDFLVRTFNMIIHFIILNKHTIIYSALVHNTLVQYFSANCSNIQDIITKYSNMLLHVQ